MFQYIIQQNIYGGVQSIINQSFKDYELFLIDDGSTDNSGKICDELASLDNRIKVIHKSNGGLSSARNIGLKNAKGDFIAFMDSDDELIGNNLYSEVMDCFNNNPMLDIVQFDTLFCYKSNSEHKRIYPLKKYSDKAEILKAYLSENIHVACWDKIFKRKVFEDILFPEGQTSEDIAIIPQIVTNSNNLKTTDIGYYGYTYREDSISHATKSYNQVCSILHSYYIFCSYAFTFKSVRSLATQVYTDQFWMYLSYIRIYYPDRVNDFCKQIETLQFPFRQWLKYNRSMPLKTKLRTLIITMTGTQGAAIFQKIFTGNFKKNSK